MENQSTPGENTSEIVSASEGQQPQINAEKLNRYYEQIKQEQNLLKGAGASLLAAIAGGLVWAVITVITEYQIGYMAIAVGFLVGFANRYAGKGQDKIFGFVGAFFAIFGCLLGNYFSIIGFAANAENLGYLDTLFLIPFSSIPDIMAEGFRAMDLLFYSIAAYEGFKFSFRVLTDEEIIANASDD
jgi:hypothetical protein